MNIYDTIILGGGPSGLTSGIYACRAQLRTLLIDKMMVGGQVVTTDWIENYPGFNEGISGPDLVQKMEKQAKQFGLEIVFGLIEKIDFQKKPKRIVVGRQEYFAHTIIIATGNEPKLLGVPGEKEFKGRGVSYCATCDGPFFKDKDIVVIGGGNSGLQESLYLTRFVRSIKLVEFMDHLTAEKILQKRVKDNSKFQFFLYHTVLSINGEQKVESVTIKNRKTDKIIEIHCDGVFIWAGMKPNTELLPKEIKMDSWKYIHTNEVMETSIKGVYAAGDVRSKTIRQITTAIGDGTIAAESALKYIETLEPREKE